MCVPMWVPMAMDSEGGAVALGPDVLAVLFSARRGTAMAGLWASREVGLGEIEDAASKGDRKGSHWGSLRMLQAKASM